MYDSLNIPWILVPNPVNDYDDQVFDDDEQIDVEGNIDSALADTLDQLTADTLNRLPRQVAIDGILAFGEFKNELMDYLKKFADNGKIVTKEDIEEFFEARKEKKC